MMENLHDDICRLESKHEKDGKLSANTKWKLEGGKYSKTFFKVLERQNMQNQKTLIVILMIKKQNILATLMIFLNQLKTFMKNFIPKRQPPKLPLLNFLTKFVTERRSHIDNFTFVSLKYL